MQTKDLKELQKKMEDYECTSFCCPHTEIDDPHYVISLKDLDHAIQSAVKEREKEIIEKVERALTGEKLSGMGIFKLNIVLSELSKKEKGGD